MSNAIAPYVDPAIEDVKRLANLVLALRNEVFLEGQDYGVIPGTDNGKDKPKPVLLLPGMEKLMRALRLRPEYVERLVIRDYDRPLFHYEYECRLVEQETNVCISTAVGLATSHESKWRWREAKRVCPHCEQAAIIKGKAEYGGGWLCFAKKGGCGAKFKDGDAAIEDQIVGRVENPDIFDQINTISKIAQKRALSSAIKGAANVSEFFTVDLEDFQNYEVNAPKQNGHVVDAVVTVEDAPPPSPRTDGPLHFVCAPIVYVNQSKSGKVYYSFKMADQDDYIFTWERQPFRAVGWDVDGWVHDGKPGSIEYALDRKPIITARMVKGRWEVVKVVDYKDSTPIEEAA